MDISKVTKVINLPCTSDTFFRWWFEVLKPVHHLTNKEADVIAAFVKLRYDLSHSITDPDLLDDVVMQEKCKKEVRKMTGVSCAFFQVVMSKLRQAGVIKNGKINPLYIPPLNEDGVVCLTYLMKIDDTKRNNQSSSKGV